MRLQDNGGPVYMNGTAGANNCAPKPTPYFLHMHKLASLRKELHGRLWLSTFLPAQTL